MGHFYLFAFLILVPVFPHALSAALRRYVDPFSCEKYYIRHADKTFSLNTCPPNHVFNPTDGICVKSGDYTECPIGKRPKFTFLGLEEICKGQDGYYCSSTFGFTYCTRDNVKIFEDRLCPSGGMCIKHDYPETPCPP